MSTAMITSKGQTTIPKRVRDALKLKPGDRVEFNLQDGQAVMRAASCDVRALKGMLPKARRSATLEQMDAAIKLAVSRRYLRTRTTNPA